jgi:hypothetical protein
MRETDENYESEYETTRRPRSRGAIVVMAVLAIGIIALIIWTVIMRKSTYTSWESLGRNENIPNAVCMETDKGYILYNNDGAEGHDAGGHVIWKISYDLTSPIAAAGGDYAAFADRGANTVHVTDGSGSNNVINVSEKIAGLCVASQGVTAIRTDGGDYDHIYIYDYSGNMLLDIKTEVRKSGFPVTMALSNDGRKLVTSYLQAGQTQAAWITFYNFGDVGQSYADKIVGSYSFEDSLIPDVRFLGNDRVLISDDKQSVLYKFREVPEEIKRYGGDGVTASVTGRGGYFAIAKKLNDGICNITVYNNNGGETASVETGLVYDTMNVENGELILTGGDSCVIYRKNGKEKFRSRLGGTIALVIPSGADAEYTAVEDGFTEVIRLKTGEDTVSE